MNALRVQHPSNQLSGPAPPGACHRLSARHARSDRGNRLERARPVPGAGSTDICRGVSRKRTFNSSPALWDHITAGPRTRTFCS